MKERERINELGPIRWISDERLITVNRIDIPLKKESQLFLQLGYLERSNKYILMEIEKTYMDDELLDVSRNFFKFGKESAVAVSSLLKENILDQHENIHQ